MRLRRTVNTAASKTVVKDDCCTFGCIGRHLNDVFVASAGTSAVERALAAHCVCYYVVEVGTGFRVRYCSMVRVQFRKVYDYIVFSSWYRVLVTAVARNF